MRKPTPYRKMSRAAFRADQHAGIRLPHIAPFNALVDELRADPDRGWMPYIAPMYGGVHARVLSVLRDPGPKTQDEDGSGMLCVENDDDAAQYMSELLAGAGVPVAELVPWNAYPWYMHVRGTSKVPNAEQLNAGVEPLRRVIDLMPDLRVVIVHGGTAHDAWDRFEKRHRSTAARSRVLRTFHTARTTFRHPDPAVRESRHQHLRDTFAELAEILRSADGA